MVSSFIQVISRSWLYSHLFLDRPSQSPCVCVCLSLHFSLPHTHTWSRLKDSHTVSTGQDTLSVHEASGVHTNQLRSPERPKQTGLSFSLSPFLSHTHKHTHKHAHRHTRHSLFPPTARGHQTSHLSPYSVLRLTAATELPATEPPRLRTRLPDPQGSLRGLSPLAPPLDQDVGQYGPAPRASPGAWSHAS